MLLKMVWHMHKDNSNKDLQSRLPNNILFWQFYPQKIKKNKIEIQYLLIW